MKLAKEGKKSLEPVANYVSTMGCVCSSGSSSAYYGSGCQCNGGSTNYNANYNLAN